MTPLKRRKTIRFELRVGHPVDDRIDEIIRERRSRHKGAAFFRNGVILLDALERGDALPAIEIAPKIGRSLALLSSLEQGDLSVLFEMFPLLRNQFVGQDLIAEFFSKIPQNKGFAPAPIPAVTVTEADNSVDSAESFFNSFI